MIEFSDVYDEITRVVRRNSAGSFVHFEDTKLASQDSSRIQRVDLMEISSDREFVKNCFYKILGRNPSPHDIRNYTNALARGRLDRDMMIETLFESEEYTVRGNNVRLV